MFCLGQLLKLFLELSWILLFLICFHKILQLGPWLPLRGKVHDQEANPAADDANGGVGAGKHQGQELVPRTKHELMQQGAVDNERDADCNVERAEPVKEEEAGARRGGREAIKRQQKEHEPEDGVDGLDRELGRRKQQREEGHVACHGERPECAQVPPVLKREQTERDNDKEHGLLMDVPAEEERRVTAERDGANKVVPGRRSKELQQRQCLEDDREDEARARADIGQDRKRRVSDQTAGDAGQRLRLDMPPKARGN